MFLLLSENERSGSNGPRFATMVVRVGLWHNQGVSEGTGGREGHGRRRRPARPLDNATLGELALAYVARFATSRAKLTQYLRRKLKERGWAGDGEPDLPSLVARLSDQGFVDDRLYADAKAQSLLRRGYGGQRVRAALGLAGIEDVDRSGALEAAESQALEAALRFARKRRIGPFATGPLDEAARAKALGAMLRAGHGFELARRIVNSAPGELLEPE